MKNLILNSLLLLALIGFTATNAEAVVAPKNAPQAVTSVFDLPAEDILNLDKKQLAKKIGRSLTWKEKMALKWAKKKMKKQKRQNSDKALHHSSVDGMAVAGFVLSLVGLFFWGVIFGVMGLIFSAVALSRMRKDSSIGGKGLAIAGLVMGILGILIWSALIATFIAFV